MRIAGLLLSVPLLLLAGCGWNRQDVADLLAGSGGGQGDPAQAAKAFDRLGGFVTDPEPGPPAVRAAAMEAMVTIALDRGYRDNDPAAWHRLIGILDAEFTHPRLPDPAADADRARLRARALWNLGRLGSAAHVSAATTILADLSATAELPRAALDLLAHQSAVLAGDAAARPAVVAALARRLGATPEVEPASVRHLVGALVDIPTLVPLLGSLDGAARVVGVRWLRQLLTAATTVHAAMPAAQADAIRAVLLVAAHAERPVAEQARAALLRWSPAAWADACLGCDKTFTPVEQATDLAILLPDLDVLVHAAGGNGWRQLRDGVMVLDEGAALAPGTWSARRSRLLARVLDQAAVADPVLADQLCVAVLRSDPAALVRWFAADPRPRPAAVAVRFLAALAADPVVVADAGLRTQAWQALAKLLAVPDPGLRETIAGVLIERDPALLAEGALAVLAGAEAESSPACTILARIAIVAANAAPQARPGFAPLALVFRRNLAGALPAARALLVRADPGLLADLTLTERYARGIADLIDAQVLAELLQATAVDGERAAAVEARLRALVDGADEDAALVAATCLVQRMRTGGMALPESHWNSVRRLAALAATTH